MKKFSVLLVAAAVALSASAGVTNSKALKIVDTKEAKAKVVKGDMRASKMLKRGSMQTFSATPLQAFVKGNFVPASPAIKATSQVMWDFETEDQLEGWQVIDADYDGYCWEYSNSEGMVAHSGTGVIASASYQNDPSGNGGTALTPDNWLITPQMDLGGVLSFYACGQDPSYAAEVFAVYLAVGEPETTDDFVKISADITTTGAMTLYTIDLTQYEGQTGCIAFRHYNVTDQFRLNIDDVAMTYDGDVPTPDPEPETPTIITEQPEGQLVSYLRSGACIYSGFFGLGITGQDGKINVVYAEDGKAYIQNPLWYIENGNWVEGTYDAATGIITVPTGQYLAWYEGTSYGDYGVQLMWGSTYVYTDTDPETGEEGYYLGTELDDRTTEIQFLVDGDHITLLGSEGDMNAEFPENYNATGLYAMYSDDQSWAGALEFNTQGVYFELVPAVPANASADEWSDCGDESGFSMFYFTLPTTDVDGNPIDPEYLSYSIYVDNGNGPELFTFDAVTYSYDIAEDITEVPFSLYSSAMDFHNSYVYFYRTNAEGYEPLFTENIGIKVYYTVDGVKNESPEIAWLYDTHVAVDEVNAGKTVANVRYFNVAGQEMAQPEGMTIQVTTYTDGTKSAVKVVK